MNALLTHNSFKKKKSVRIECIKKLNQLYAVLSEKKQSVVSRKQSVVFLQQQQCLGFKTKTEKN